MPMKNYYFGHNTEKFPGKFVLVMVSFEFLPQIFTDHFCGNLRCGDSHAEYADISIRKNLREIES
jgi:hypothetical protein